MILVTGANGLLGAYLTKELLKQGFRVRGLRRINSDLSLLGEAASKVEWIIGDVLDVVSLEVAMKDIEQVYHCAAIISFTSAEVNKMMKTNIEGTANVMNAALHAGVKRVLHVSSVAAFGLHKADVMIDEQTVYVERKDMIHYYRSKQMAEREAWRAQAEGLNVVLANPGTIIGAGKWDMEPNSVFRDIYAGLPFYTTGVVGFVDVRDVVSALITIMQHGESGDQYIVSAENLSFEEFLASVAQALGVRKPFLPANNILVKLAVCFEWIKSKLTGRRALLTAEMARIANMKFHFSNNKIKTRLGVKFRPMQETIHDTAQAFLQSKKSGKNFATFDDSKNHEKLKR